MTNILLQSASLALMLFLLLSFLRQRRLGLDNEKIFLITLCITIASLVLDILSIHFIKNKLIYPEILVDTICRMYLDSLLLIFLSVFVYVCVDSAIKRKSYIKQMYAFIFISMIAIIHIHILPINYYYNGVLKVVYSYGMGVYLTYIFTFLIMIYTVFVAYHAKGIVSGRRREAITYWFLISSICAFIQFFNREILVVGFGCALSELVLFIMLENPETKLDKTSRHFNQHAFVLYTSALYAEMQKFAIVSVVFNKNAEVKIKHKDLVDVKLEILQFFSKNKKFKLFKNSEDEYLFVYKNAEDSIHFDEDIIRPFRRGWGPDNEVHMHTTVRYMPDARIVGNSDVILHALRYANTYTSEYSNKDYCVIDEAVIQEMNEEHNRADKIVNAIKCDKVVVYYQPIYSTELNRFVSAEALVRIIDENGDVLAPSNYIKTAEKNGFIIKLGEIIFEKVCQFLQEINLNELGLEYIEVNLSVLQCEYTNLAKEFIAIMKKYKVNPKWINLEITESASYESKKILLKNMKELMDFGVRFSLDDFGTGQSNLNYIVDMPVDIVKFDKGMIDAYFENGKAKYVMDAAMHMIQGMNLKIVSEGIETKEQYDAMDKLGISYIQGYYFSKPLPPEEFVEFIKQSRQDI